MASQRLPDGPLEPWRASTTRGSWRGRATTNLTFNNKTPTLPTGSTRGRGQARGRGSGIQQPLMGVPGRALPDDLFEKRGDGAKGRGRGGMGEWNRAGSANSARQVDPMSLVTSPSRDPSSPLVSPAFQLKFQAYLVHRLSLHRQLYPHPLGLLLSHAQGGSSGDFKKQKESGEREELEWRKLREGCVSVSERGERAVDVYRTSLQLAVETLSIPALQSLLPTLALHLSHSEETSKAEYAASLLLLPICTRLHLGDFQSTLKEVLSTGVSRTDRWILFAVSVFRHVRRKNWIGIRRLLPPNLSTSSDLAIPEQLLLLLLPLFRTLALQNLQKAFYQGPEVWIRKVLFWDCFPMEGGGGKECEEWLVGKGVKCEDGVVVFKVAGGNATVGKGS